MRTVIEGVTRVKASTLHQVARVVDEDECVAMEVEEDADVLSQQQDKLFFFFVPWCLRSFSLCSPSCALTGGSLSKPIISFPPTLLKLTSPSGKFASRCERKEKRR